MITVTFGRTTPPDVIGMTVTFLIANRGCLAFFSSEWLVGGEEAGAQPVAIDKKKRNENNQQVGECGIFGIENMLFFPVGLVIPLTLEHAAVPIAAAY